MSLAWCPLCLRFLSTQCQITRNDGTDTLVQTSLGIGVSEMLDWCPWSRWPSQCSWQHTRRIRRSLHSPVLRYAYHPVAWWPMFDSSISSRGDWGRMRSRAEIAFKRVLCGLTKVMWYVFSVGSMMPATRVLYVVGSPWSICSALFSILKSSYSSCDCVSAMIMWI